MSEQAPVDRTDDEAQKAEVLAESEKLQQRALEVMDTLDRQDEERGDSNEGQTRREQFLRGNIIQLDGIIPGVTGDDDSKVGNYIRLQLHPKDQYNEEDRVTITAHAEGVDENGDRVLKNATDHGDGMPLGSILDSQNNRDVTGLEAQGAIASVLGDVEARVLAPSDV